MSLLNTFGDLKRRLSRGWEPDTPPLQESRSRRQELAEDLQRAPRKATMKREFNGIPVWTIE